MRRIRCHWPSPAMVVACVALTVALGGTSYAALKLPANSVGTKQLKNNAVTSPKVKKNSLTGADVRESTLTTVPSATNAEEALTVSDQETGDSLGASSSPEAGDLLPLASDGHFPPSAMTNVTARIYNSTDEAIPLQIAGGPVTRLTFDRVSFDTANLFDPSHPTRLRAPIAGVYLINANVSWQVSSTSGLNRAVVVYVNDHAVSVDQRPPAAETRQVVTTLYRLAAGDEVAVGVGQDEAGSLNVDAVGDYAPSLGMAWIAPG
jgi:hypothetical protein